jgi:Domain of unknown function (DUF4365)
MPTYKRSAVTSKVGINFVRSIVEAGGSLFIKIEQENDLGIDAIVEFIRDEQPLNKQVALQIKSGASYFLSESHECIFPIGSHRAYWLKHPLPVFGIVYVPPHRSAYWVNVKRYLKSYPDLSVVRFKANAANRLGSETFESLFLPAATGSIPSLEFDEALRLSTSLDPSEFNLALLVLFRRFPNRHETWDAIVQTITSRPREQVPPQVIYWLAHIPWHADIGYFGETLLPETRSHAKGLLATFGQQEVLRLLSYIDPEGQISRGAVGQSVEAIVSSLPNVEPRLERIALNTEYEMTLREYACIILAMKIGLSAMPVAQRLESEGSWYGEQVRLQLQEFGCVDPYQ